jgi:TRAP-type C4-dicarboxylate transport system permease small subunit
MSSPEPPRGDALDALDRGLARVEGALCLGALAMMIGLSTMQLVLRKGWDSGFEWADVVVRQGVVWTAFVGGALATQQARHIAIDAATKLMAPRRAAALRALTALVAAVIAAVMARASWVFLQAEIERAEELLPGVPQWWSQAVIPTAFGLVTFHFVVAARDQLLVALGRREPAPEPEGVGARAKEGAPS